MPARPPFPPPRTRLCTCAPPKKTLPSALLPPHSLLARSFMLLDTFPLARVCGTSPVPSVHFRSSLWRAGWGPKQKERRGGVAPKKRRRKAKKGWITTTARRSPFLQSPEKPSRPRKLSIFGHYSLPSLLSLSPFLQHPPQHAHHTRSASLVLYRQKGPGP